MRIETEHIRLRIPADRDAQLLLILRFGARAYGLAPPDLARSIIEFCDEGLKRLDAREESLTIQTDAVKAGD